MQLYEWYIKENKVNGKCHMSYHVSKNTRFEILIGEDDTRNPIYSVIRVAVKKKPAYRRKELGQFNNLEEAVEFVSKEALKYVPTDYAEIAKRRKGMYHYMRSYCATNGIKEN